MAILVLSLKSIYDEIATAIDCTLRVVPSGFCSVQVMPLFGISFWLLRRSDKKLNWDLGILNAIYIPHSHQALKLQCDDGVCRAPN